MQKLLSYNDLLPQVQIELLEELVLSESTTRGAMGYRLQADKARLMLARILLHTGINKERATQLIQVQMERLLVNEQIEMLEHTLVLLSEHQILPVARKKIIEAMIKAKNRELERIAYGKFYANQDEKPSEREVELTQEITKLMESLTL